MKPRQRQAAILEYLQKQGKCSVEELAQYFDTTGTTIRKDLVILEHAGTVIRTYGGVVLNKEELNNIADTFELSMQFRIITELFMMAIRSFLMLAAPCCRWCLCSRALITSR